MIVTVKKSLQAVGCLLALAAPLTVWASSSCRESIADVVSSQGKVDINPYKTDEWQGVIPKAPLCPGDTLRTFPQSRATLRLRNQTVLTVDQNTTMTFSAPAQQTSSSWFVKLLQGAGYFRNRQPQHLDIRTPFINAVHQGTEFLVAVNTQNAEISVFDGVVNGENAAGKISIAKGYKGIAGMNQVPRLEPLKIKPEDAVQWTLYYPPIVDEALAASPANAEFAPALSIYRQGNYYGALSKLDAVPDAQRNALFYYLKAALLLTLGRADEASVNIASSQRLQPGNSYALALESIIAVAKNRQQQALIMADQAVAKDPASATARIAQSYAYQALFQLDKATQAVTEAVRLSPQNALAWGRLAELQFEQGDRAAALTSVQKAISINPMLARTQTVLGFVNLAETQVNQAKQRFQQAMTLDFSDPLPRLGLGLAKIREGDVEAGKTELETAVNLDPNNSVVRSYLGKAYYELKNKTYAGKEYELAKEMDPKDPTPWFYDAILKQTINQPVPALHDMQKAIALNDNRGVYRSKLLLDSDSAARSASIGRIYNDLGFQQRGLLEGWNSLNQDPSNYSAHRLLADNYEALPRHEISRLSELLKAQLLQPVNITPVQPQTAESNILILDGLGPSITSFNEYNPLYTRNRFALQASGFYGSRNTLSDEAVQSGVWDKFSYSLGQFHYQTDGFRPNNDKKRDAYNAFAQVQLTPDTNAQIELRHTEEKNGDVNQGFYFDHYSKDTRISREVNSIRGGLHHKFSENSDLLASVVYRSDGQYYDYVDATDKIRSQGTQYEAQHIYKHKQFDLISGFTYSHQHGKTTSTNDYYSFPYQLDNNRLEHGALYVYSNIKLLPKLTMLAGVTQDFFRISTMPLPPSVPKVGGVVQENPINPKFGLTWMATEDTTVRFAAFRALKRGIIQKQTLEPTQNAGFNQFYDDRDGTLSTRIGLGVDHKLSSHLFVGGEFSRRHLEVLVPTFDAIASSFTKFNWNEENARAYVNWTPTEQLALGANYSYEGLIRRSYPFFDSFLNQSNFFTDLATHKGQIFANFYHPSGFIAKTSLTLVNQTGNFLSLNDFLLHPDHSSFWLLDAELGYRLPKRYGLLSLGIKNLLDEHYNYQGTDINIAMPVQGRFLYSRLTLSF